MCHNLCIVEEESLDVDNNVNLSKSILKLLAKLQRNPRKMSDLPSFDHSINEKEHLENIQLNSSTLLNVMNMHAEEEDVVIDQRPTSKQFEDYQKLIETLIHADISPENAKEQLSILLRSVSKVNMNEITK